MFRVLIAIMVLGGVAIYFGYQEYAVGAGATAEAQQADLSKLEQGGELESTHVRFGDHLRLYYGQVYKFENETGTDPGLADKVTKAYYPIISSEHVFSRRLDALMKQYGSIQAIPDGEWRGIDRFKVLVKTDEYHTVGEVENLPPFKTSDSIRGLVVNSIESLSSKEEKFIRERFPNVDLDRVIILEKDRKPWPKSLSMGLMAGGFAMIAFPAIGLLLLHKRNKAEEEAALASAEGQMAGGYSADSVTGPSTATESAVGEVPPPPPATGGEPEQKNSADEDDDKNPYRV
jgi:hypothetical protein